jgi:hypothetical protein
MQDGDGDMSDDEEQQPQVTVQGQSVLQFEAKRLMGILWPLEVFKTLGKPVPPKVQHVRVKFRTGIVYVAIGRELRSRGEHQTSVGNLCGNQQKPHRKIDRKRLWPLCGHYVGTMRARSNRVVPT